MIYDRKDAYTKATKCVRLLKGDRDRYLGYAIRLVRELEDNGFYGYARLVKVWMSRSKNKV